MVRISLAVIGGFQFKARTGFNRATMRIFPFWSDHEPLPYVLTKVLALSAKFGQLVPQLFVWSPSLSIPPYLPQTGNERWATGPCVHTLTKLDFKLFYCLLTLQPCWQSERSVPQSLICYMLLTTRELGEPYNTFDGPGFPACNEVSQVYSPTTVEDIVALVKDASLRGTPVRASGVRTFLLSFLIYLIYP